VPIGSSCQKALFSDTSKEFDIGKIAEEVAELWEWLVKNTLHDVYVHFNECRVAKTRSEIKMRDFYAAVNAM
jgi:hypothetical protein